MIFWLFYESSSLLREFDDIICYFSNKDLIKNIFILKKHSKLKEVET